MSSNIKKDPAARYYVSHDYSVRRLSKNATECYAGGRLVGYIDKEMAVYTNEEGEGLYATAEEASRASFEMRLKGISPQRGILLEKAAIDIELSNP